MNNFERLLESLTEDKTKAKAIITEAKSKKYKPNKDSEGYKLGVKAWHASKVAPAQDKAVMALIGGNKPGSSEDHDHTMQTLTDWKAGHDFAREENFKKTFKW